MMPVDSFESNDGSVALLEQLDAQLELELEVSALLGQSENSSEVDPFHAIDSEILARIFETTSAQSTDADEGTESSSGALLEELGALLAIADENETIDFLTNGLSTLDGESGQGIDTLDATESVSSTDSFVSDSLEIALRDEAIVNPVSHAVEHASAKIVLLDRQLDFREALEAAVAADAKLFVYDSTVETASQVLFRVEDWVRATETQVSSLSILSHGAAGGFELGSDWITDGTIGAYLTEFNSLASYFCEDAKIYILGCNVVSDSQGQVLLDRLAEATGAEIHASSNITGFGGDWELESHSFNVLSQDLDELESILNLDSLKSTEVTLAWYNSSWNYRQTVTVDDAMVSGTSDLTNFTVLVNVTQNNFKWTSSGGRVGQADGGDFVFTLGDGTTKLSHQIESYNSTTGNLVAWVKLPTLAYNGDTSLFVYYGNATAADQWNAAGTWSSDVRANYHLASDFKDSTGNANNATNSGTTAVATAKIAGGDQFNGISSKLAASDSSSLDVTGNLTVSGWFNSSNLSGYKALVAKGTSSTAVNYYVATKGTEMQFAFYAAGGLRSFTTSGAGLTTGTWYNFAVTYDDTANSVNFYLDGNQIYSATTTHSLVANSGSLTIGTSPWNEWFNGSIDEIKVEAATKSASWIQTQYSNQNSPGSYITVSGEQGPPVLTSGSQVSILEGTNLVTTLTATDPRFTNPTFSYSIIGGPDAAQFVIDSATGALSFASAPIYYSPADVGADNVYNIVVQVSSGTLTGTQSLTVSVNNVNDAPTIDAGAVYELAVIDEDTTGPSGTLVSTILSSASYSDVDPNALSGIAVTSLTGVGVWQYSMDGVSWTGFGAVLDSNALLLDSSTQIRFLPDGNNGETASFSYRAWDRTTGNASSNGSPQKANATLTGGTTAFSDNIATSSILVNDLNDAPIITDGYTNSLPSMLANMISSSTTVGQLLASSGYSDVDLGAISGIAVTSMTGLGTWQYSTDGLSWRDFNHVSSSQALLLDSTSQIRYLAPNNVAETATFAFRGWDQSLGTASTDQLAHYANTSTSGSTSPFSEEVATASLTVIYINESPIAQSDTSTSFEAGGVSNFTGGANPTGNVLTNDSDGNFGDQLTVVGVASGNVTNGSGSVGTSINGQYGSLVLLSNGDYSYVLNNDNSEVQGLKGPSQTLNDTFTYTIHDLSGASSSAQLVFTIVGTNDAPHALAGVLFVNENATTGTTVGVVSTADVDYNETFSYSLIDNAGGRFAIDSVSGVITVANGLLLDYESNAEHFVTVRTTDQGGLVFDQTLSIGLVDVNEAPTAVVDMVQAVEAGGHANSALGVNPTGNVLNNDLDQDFSDTKAVIGVAAGLHASTSGSVNTSIEGAYGALTLAADGSFIYIVANESSDVQRLRTSSETLQDIFTYSMIDAGGSTSATQITITIQGANDAPTGMSDTAIAIEASGVANGVAGINPTGNVLTNDTDVDAVDTKTVSGVAAGVQGSAGGSVGSSVTGLYGSITINADGTYNYMLDNSITDVQALRTAADTLQDVFTYTMVDSGGSSSTTQITVTIQGQNDVPYDLTSGTLSVNENAANGTVVGSITGHDVDSGDTLTYSLTDSAGGRFAINSTTGQVTVADGSLLNFEAMSWHNITVRVTDTAGTSYDEQFTIDLSDLNEAPVTVSDSAIAVEAGGVANGAAGTNPSGNVLTNDTDVDAGGTKTVSGVTAGSVASASGDVGSVVAGSFGSITINADGSYSYAVDNSKPVVQAMRTTTDTLQDVFTYTMVDSGGLSSTTQITVTIRGQNDVPYDLTSGTLSVNEDAANGTVVGSIIGNDVDSGDTLTYSLTDSAGGRFAINSTTGQVTVADGSLLNFEAMSWHNITVRVTDAAGTTYDEIFAISLNDVNETPVAVSDSVTAVEAGGVANGDGGVSPAGNVLSNDSDVDLGDTKTVRGVAAGVQGSAVGLVDSSVTGLYGSITINADGSYSNTVDNSIAAVQALRIAADTLQDVFTYTMVDSGGLSSTAQITVTIQGQNDVPHDLTNGILAVNENAAIGTVVGSIIGHDVDSGDTLTYSLTDSAGGRFAINSTTGQVTVADGSLLNFEALPSHNIMVRVTDTAGTTYDEIFAIDLNDVNETPVAVSDSVTAVEAGGVANGSAGSNPAGNVLINDTDVDAGDTKTVSGVAAGSLASASGLVGTSVTGSYGSITINSDGSYSYTVDNSNSDVQALRTTANTLQDVFTYTMVDSGGLSSTTQITVTIQGQNDNSVAVSDSTLAVEAGGYSNGTSGTNPTGNVLSNDTDVDSGDSKTVSGVAAGVQASTTGSVGSSVTGSYGWITVNSDGSYSYTVENINATVQALRTSSETINDVFSYTVTDTAGTTSTTQITVTIQGRNDAPGAVDDTPVAIEAGGVSNGSAGTNPTGNLLINDTDIDAGDSKTVTGVVAGTAASASGSVGVNLSGSYGSITVNADGTHSYVVDNSNAAVQALRTTANTLQDLFTYTMQDAGGLSSIATVTVTIQGANDTPVAVANTATAVEAGGILNNISGSDPTGNVLTNDTDVDDGDTKTVVGVVAGNQAPASGNVDSSVSGLYGLIQIAANGVYSYTLNNSNAAVEALNSGQTLTETFTYTVSDTAGATSTTTIVITIQGVDDLPFAVVDMDTAVEAGGVNNATPGTSPSGNVLSNDIAPNGETVVGVTAGLAGSASGSVGVTVTGLYGTVVLNADGTYTYTIDNNNSAVQALRVSSDHLTDLFTYTMEDGLGNQSTTQLTITLDGRNDAAVANNDSAAAVEAGGVGNGSAGSKATGNVLSNDTDVDAGDTKAVIGVASGAQSSAVGNVGSSVTGTYGSIVVNADGSYSYTVNNNNAAVQALRTAGDTLQEVFTYTMEDTAGLTSTATVTIAIQGANDLPVAVGDNAVATEAGGTLNGTAGANPSGNVLSTDTDVDSGDTKAVSGVAAGLFANTSGSVGSSVTGSFGAITINADGSYSYIVNNSNAAVQALRTSGDTLQDVFSYTMTDTAGAVSTTQITITIQGANDAPVLTPDTADAVEAGGYANATAGNNPCGNVLSNDSDVDAGDSMLVSGVAAGIQSSAIGNVNTVVNGAYGSINIAGNGTYTYTVDNSSSTVQALRTNGNTVTDVFTYTMIDASGLASSTQITVTIRGENDSPRLFALASVSIDENTAQGVIVGTVAATDVDCGDSLQFSLTESYGGAFAIDNSGRILVNNSSLLDRESVSAITITVRVSDLAGAWAEQNIEVNLNDVDEFNVGAISDRSASSNSIAENSIGGSFVGIVAFASDSDSTLNKIHYTLDDSAGGRFTIDGNTGSVYVANASGLDFESANSHTILVRATSSDGSTSTQCFTIALTDVNETVELLPVFDGSFDLLSGVGTPSPLPNSELPPLASILEDKHQGSRSANVEEIAAEWNRGEAINFLDHISQPATTAWTFDNMVVGIAESVIESTWVDGTEDFELSEHDRIYVGFMDCENLSSLKSLTEILFGSRSGLGLKSFEQNSESTFYGLSESTWDDLVPIGVCSVLVIWSAYVAKLGSSLLVSACGGFFLIPPGKDSEEKKEGEQRVLRRVDKFH